jgi:hypothetical protein
MPTYNPLDSRFLTTANAITRDGQKFVRIILDIQENQFYTLDDNDNFIPIGSGGTSSSSGVTSINVGTGLSASSSTGAVTIVNTGVTGSGVVNTENGVYYFALWTATTPTSSAVTTNEITNSSVYETDAGIGFTKPIYAQQSIVIGVNGYTMPSGAGTAGQILGYDTADPPSFGWQSLSSLLPQNIYGNLNGGIYTFSSLIVNQWEQYNGEWTKYITNVVNRSGSIITITDPLVTGHIIMFNVTGEVNATANHQIEIGWAYNNATPLLIDGSTQVTHLRSGVPVGNFNHTFFAEINQGSNDFRLFARNITDSTNITLTNINVTISTINVPLA